MKNARRSSRPRRRHEADLVRFCVVAVDHRLRRAGVHSADPHLAQRHRHAAPWPGEIGQRVYENVSAQAWKLWEDRQKMILNEYRVMPWQKEGQEVIRTHMEDFFFGAGSALPPDFVPVQSK